MLMRVARGGAHWIAPFLNGSTPYRTTTLDEKHGTKYKRFGNIDRNYHHSSPVCYNRWVDSHPPPSRTFISSLEPTVAWASRLRAGRGRNKNRNFASAR